MRDYSRRYSPTVGGKQKVYDRKKRHDKGGFGGHIWKMLGLVVTVAMAAGVIGSFWFGWAIRNSLDEISQLKKTRQELTVLNNTLADRRDQLMSEERIEDAAKKIGLYPPAPVQIRKP